MKQPTRVFDLLQFQLNNYREIDMFSSKINDEWRGIKTQEFIDQVKQISKGLMSLGVRSSDKVAIVSENRLEWNLLDFAIQQVGAVVVAVYSNISDDDYQFIFNDAEIKVCFVSNDSLYQRLVNIQSKIPNVKHIYSLNNYPQIPNWNQMIELGTHVSDEQIQQSMDQVQPDDLATLIYTSGTTGNPKGVMLSHKNLLADVFSSEYSFPTQAYDRALTFLPACHAYERCFQYVYIYMGVSIYYAESMDKIGENIKEIKPHIFSAVPRVLEKVFDKIMTTGEQLTGIKRKLFFWAIALGEQYDLDETQNSTWYKFQLKIARKLIFSKWKKALGGNIKGIASGSATLQERLLRIYLAAGIPIWEGYGLTEAGPCVSVNCFKRGVKIGSVGVPLINIEVKLAEDGEVLVKGDNVMQGYYKNPEATAEVLQNGWLHTGDIGVFEGKFLKIVDRKKEMFKTSGGKYIVPQQIEKKMVESKFIEQAMVVGEGKHYPAALIVPNYLNLLDWAQGKIELQNLSKSDFLNHEVVQQKIQEEVDNSNQHFGNWEKVKRFAILPEEFTIETEELTPTLKMKRKIILEKFKSEIDAIYS